MKCDLHVHTNFSDSSNSVEEVLKLADQEQLDYLALSDHDTTETYAYAKTIVANHRVKIIPAIEISAYDFKRDRKVHLIGYNYKQSKNLDLLCGEVLDRRKANSEKQLSMIKEAGYPIDDDKLLYSVNSKKTLYKQQIVYALVGKPHWTDEYQEIYKRLFKSGSMGQMDISYVDMFDALEAIIMDGGVPILAHPGQYDSFEAIPALINKGLKGLEIFHPKNSEEDRRRLMKIAAANNLIITGGSDHHGIFGEQYAIGTHEVKKEAIDRILA